MGKAMVNGGMVGWCDYEGAWSGLAKLSNLHAAGIRYLYSYSFDLICDPL